MTRLDVDPKTYYRAATNCFDAAAALRDSFIYIFDELSECGSMAGVDQDGQQWGASYNAAAYQTVGMFEDVHSTLNAYGRWAGARNYRRRNEYRQPSRYSGA